MARVEALGIRFPLLAKVSSPDVDQDQSSFRAGELGHGGRLPILGVVGTLPRAMSGEPRSHTISPTRRVPGDLTPTSAETHPARPARLLIHGLFDAPNLAVDSFLFDDTDSYLRWVLRQPRLRCLCAFALPPPTRMQQLSHEPHAGLDESGGHDLELAHIRLH